MTDKGEERLLEAKRLMAEKQYTRAGELLEKLEKAHTNHPLIQFYLGSVYDALGREREAISYYQGALKNKITGVHREEAFIQLGSSLRAIGEYHEAKNVLLTGLKEFPENRALQLFLAMTLYHLGEHKEAVAMLLKIAVAINDDPWIGKYAKAISFYADHLDQTW